MPMLALPHTAGCLVCGRSNPHGLHLELRVDEAAGVVTVPFTPSPHHIGFQGVIHGGVLATILDEAMVWAATWAGRTFCLCGEMTVRYRKPAAVGVPLIITARVERSRGKLVTTTGDVRIAGAAAVVVAEAAGKYMPLPPADHAAFAATMLPEPHTAAAAARLS